MSTASLPVICLTAFATVFVVLAALAVLIWAVLVLFPEKKEGEGTDAAVAAALATAIHAIYPGARITRIEETK